MVTMRIPRSPFALLIFFIAVPIRHFTIAVNPKQADFAETPFSEARDSSLDIDNLFPKCLITSRKRTVFDLDIAGKGNVGQSGAILKGIAFDRLDAIRDGDLRQTSAAAECTTINLDDTVESGELC